MQMRESARNLKNVLICGKGEIGAALGFIAEQRGFVVQYYDPKLGLNPPDDFKADIVHVCYPIKTDAEINTLIDDVLDLWTESFVDLVLIIDATIPVGMAFRIHRLLVDWGCYTLVLHSPVRGRHPWMVGGLHKYVKFVGPADPTRVKETEDFCKIYYTQLGIPYKVLSSADACALGKLVDTTWYLTQIVFANQVSLLCSKFKLPFDEVYTQFQETGDTGVKFKNVNGRAICERFVPRPVMTPGAIGGHCLLPNLEILKPDISPAFYSWCKQMHEYFAGQLNEMIEQNAGVKPLEHEGDRE